MASSTANGYVFLTKGTGDDSSLIAASTAMASSSQDVLDTYIEPGLIPWVADAAGRATRVPNPVQGDRVWRNDVGYTETYFDVVSVSNVGGRPTAGWYRTGDFISTSVGVAGFTAATGWSLSTIRWKAAASWVYVSTIFTRTGGTITVPADGNIGDVVVGTMDTVLTDYLPLTTTGLYSGPGGRLASGLVISSGETRLTAVVPGTSIINGEAFSLGGSWPYL